MSEEEQQPIEQIDPGKPARDWLYQLEALARVHNFTEAGKLFHKNCVYFGLESDDMLKDWTSVWKGQRNFSVDMAQTRIIVEGNLMLACAPWVAQSLVAGAPRKAGRFTIGLMQFSNNKLLAVHAHNSYRPE